MTEEERAALYHRQAQAREQAALARWKALAGNASKYAGLLAGTEALLHDDGWDPVELLSEDDKQLLAN